MPVIANHQPMPAGPVVRTTAAAAAVDDAAADGTVDRAVADPAVVLAAAVVAASTTPAERRAENRCPDERAIIRPFPSKSGIHRVSLLITIVLRCAGVGWRCPEWGRCGQWRRCGRSGRAGGGGERGGLWVDGAVCRPCGRVGAGVDGVVILGVPTGQRDHPGAEWKFIHIRWRTLGRGRVRRVSVGSGPTRIA